MCICVPVPVWHIYSAGNAAHALIKSFANSFASGYSSSVDQNNIRHMTDIRGKVVFPTYIEISLSLISFQLRVTRAVNSLFSVANSREIVATEVHFQWPGTTE